MSKKESQYAPRKPRADASRNRERILAVARDAFTADSVNVSLDEIAKQAEVGPGTLYRHFPTRDDLLEAVYRSELQKLSDAQQTLAKSHTPVEALRAWMRLFVDYIATKQIIAPALNNIVGGPSRIYADSGAILTGAIESLVRRAVESGDIRPDLDPMDLLRALVGVSNVASAPNWKSSAHRLVDILILGSRQQ
ncbi:TetR/AcrR family transcriptional regulator [Terriglobus roseus]|uniref:Transcriptional regulator, TetR family n=1 Tax=Terriglobus roseus TaxID=392734 RepID=A0A1G7L078_9BACT|nr:TetR/AcrR family transcriptional regulator [Terriglobus roseus]SDF42510.1 transcriptional regulator, TetR family [Terriglobus roseus]